MGERKGLVDQQADESTDVYVDKYMAVGWMVDGQIHGRVDE